MRDIRSLMPEAGQKMIRIAICMSGAGSNAEALLDFAAAGDCGFEVVLLFTDSPESSRALEIGEKYQVPVKHLDIRRFYGERGESDIQLINSRRREIRNEWSEAVWDIIRPSGCDFVVFAGFVPLTNLAEKITCLNVHPGDLTVEKDGMRVYAGLHYDPVERAILAGENSLRSSVILVQGYSGDGKKELDGGAVLGISAPVPIDLAGAGLEELREIKAARTKGPFQDKLREIAKLNIEKLKFSGDHVVLPPVVKWFAGGRYGKDSNGGLCIKQDDGKWQRVRTVEFSSAGEPRPLPASKIRRLGRNRFLRYCKYLYTKIVRDNGSPDYIARGWALGMFIGCVIPVFCQLIIAIPLSFVFRGSKVGAALGTFITTPPTAVFIYPIQIWVGNRLINGNLNSNAAGDLLAVFNSETLSFSEKWSAFADMGGVLVSAFFAGGLLWALIMTPLTYFGVRFLVKRYRIMREKIFSAVKARTVKK